MEQSLPPPPPSSCHTHPFSDPASVAAAQEVDGGFPGPRDPEARLCSLTPANTETLNGSLLHFRSPLL